MRREYVAHQKVAGKGHAELELSLVGRRVLPQKIGQTQKLVMIGRTRSAGHRAPRSGRNIGEVGRHTRHRATAKVQPEPQCGEQVPFTLTHEAIAKMVDDVTV